MNVIKQYLNRYAEPESKIVDALFENVTARYKYCVVIPAHDENSDFLLRLSQHSSLKEAAQQVLLILVVNRPDGSPPNPHNQQLCRSVLNSNLVTNKEHLTLAKFNKLNILLVDRSSSENTIALKHGVGLARKIGSDIAVKLHHMNKLDTNWFYSTDADAYLPNNYFSDVIFTASQQNSISACVFNFSHQRQPNPVSEATCMYETALKYYRSGLEWAGSPYAFYTLGSTLAITIDAYCKVRGFPKRPAGEDFYLLNKLAKVGNVVFRPDIHIELEARLSQRVPFGTGPAVQEILNLHNNNQEYCYYDPKIFIFLKQWLDWITHSSNHYFAARTSKKPVTTVIKAHFSLATAELPNEVILAAESLSFIKFIEHAAQQCHNEKNFLNHFHDWFDGFKTLKFIHYIQAQYLPSKTLQQCLYESKSHWIPK